MVLSQVRLIRVKLVLVNLNPINDTYIVIKPVPHDLVWRIRFWRIKSGMSMPQLRRESSFLKTPFAILKFCPRIQKRPCFFDPMPKFEWTISWAPKKFDWQNQIAQPTNFERCPHPCRAERPQKQQLVVHLELPARVEHSRQPSHR